MSSVSSADATVIFSPILMSVDWAGLLAPTGCGAGEKPHCIFHSRISCGVGNRQIKRPSAHRGIMRVQEADCFLVPEKDKCKMGDQSLPPRLVRRNPRLSVDERSPSRTGGWGCVRCHAETHISAVRPNCFDQGSQPIEAAAFFEESKSKICPPMIPAASRCLRRAGPLAAPAARMSAI